MPAKVYQFPSQTEPTLTDIERRVRASLAELSGDERLIEHVAGRMMAYIKKYTYKTFAPDFCLPLPPLSPEQREDFLSALDKGVGAVARQVQDMISQIVIERLFLEIELYEEVSGTRNASVLGLFPTVFALLPDNYHDKVNFLVKQLKRPNLHPPEKYLLNVLLHSIIEEKTAAAEQDNQPEH